jgi:hypothetical protein
MSSLASRFMHNSSYLFLAYLASGFREAAEVDSPFLQVLDRGILLEVPPKRLLKNNAARHIHAHPADEKVSCDGNASVLCISAYFAECVKQAGCCSQSQQ